MLVIPLSRVLGVLSSRGKLYVLIKDKADGIFRFTDFLVNEVGLDGEVLRLKSIGKPVDPYDVPKDKSKGKEKEKEKEKPEAVAAPSASETEAVKEEPKQEVVQ
jgi:hypothetical protein